MRLAYLWAKGDSESGRGVGKTALLRYFRHRINNDWGYTEFKGNAEIPVSSATASLKVEKGIIKIPTGPGFGIDIDPAFLRESKEVTRS